jgi:putative membrane protein
MKTLILCTLAAVPIVALGAGNSPDESFYKKAAAGGMAEVELGKLAQEKSTDQSVKDFAAMMVKDHTAANEKLQSLAASKNIALPTHLSAADSAERTKLEALSGAAFDKAYLKSQLKAHEDTVTLLKKEVSSGQDADAKDFAKSILPTVEHHLKAARSDEGQLSAKT